MELTVDRLSPSLKKILSFSGMLIICAAYSGLWVFLFGFSHAFWFLPAGLRFVALMHMRPVYWPFLIVGEWLGIAFLTQQNSSFAGVIEHIVPSHLPSLIYPAVIGLMFRINLSRVKGVNSPFGQIDLVPITVAIIVAATASATCLFTLMPGNSPFLIFEKFSVNGIFGYALGDVAGVLFLWSTVEFLKCFTVMDQSARLIFAKNAAFLTLPFVIAFSFLLPVFEWAALALMFIPIVFLALKTGWAGATFSLMILNIIAGFYFWQTGNTVILFDTQIFLVSVGFTGLFLGAAVSRQSELMTDIRNISQRVITTQENERNRIARDLHDHIGQVLTALTLRSAILRKQAPDELKEDFDLLDQMAARVFHDIHEVVGELSPRELSEFGLNRSLESPLFHKMLTTADISYATSIDAGITDIPEQIQVAVFRISQEALSNIAKHSSATECTLTLGLLNTKGSKAIRLKIQDNGAGFDTDNYAPGHGLQNIKDRVQALRGRIELSSGEWGTLLDITLPT